LPIRAAFASRQAVAIGKNSAMAKPGAIGNCKIAQELQWRAGLQAAIQIDLAIPNWKFSPALENRGVLENFQNRAVFSLTRFFSIENSSWRENCQSF
jgi:hypothetical protein